MKDHEFRLSWMFTGMGIVLMAIVTFIFYQFQEINQLTGQTGLNGMQITIFSFVFAQAILSTSAGLISFKHFDRAEKFLLVSSILYLPSFPVGTALGVYFLWHKYFGQKTSFRNS